jgi:hypothetical protein
MLTIRRRFERSILLLAISWFIALGLSAQHKNANISFEPGKLWYDTDGHPINAHAGSVQKFEDGYYYWYGQIMITGRRGSDAWVGVSCYRSKCLHRWEYLGVALSVEDHPSSLITRGCKMERPKVIYNKKHQRYIMYWHHDINGQGHKNALLGIAKSDKPDGPFEVVSISRPLAGFYPENVPASEKVNDIGRWPFNYVLDGGSLPLNADSLKIYKRDLHVGQMVRDMTLFVDDNDKAYHIYASEENSTLHIAELTDDYLGYTGRYKRCFPGRFHEAPLVFKHNGVYFLIASGCTGWLPNPGRAAYAYDILGDWIEVENPFMGKESETSFNSQPACFLKAGENLIYIGDRWNPKNPVDARYIWLPVTIKNNQPVIKWVDKWSLTD